MTTEFTVTVQATTETRTHYIDFTPDLPTGVTITGGTAIHTPPSGSPTTPVVGVIMAGDILPVTIGPLTVVGRHIVTVTASLSDGQTSVARLIIPVEWDTARSGMVDVLAELRNLANVGSNDFKIDGIPQFTDGRLEKILDQYRKDHYREELLAVETYQAGNPVYVDYYTGTQYLEKTTGGSAIFYVEDGAGLNIGTAQYSADYNLGKLTFYVDTGGSALYWYGRSYDLYRAAAEVWRRKASSYATQFDFSTDNHSVKKSPVYLQCLKMAEYYDGKGLTSETVTMLRSDVEC